MLLQFEKMGFECYYHWKRWGLNAIVFVVDDDGWKQLTANALPDNVEECFRHGMDSFIAKPVTFLKLEQALKKFIPHPTIPATKLKKRDVQVLAITTTTTTA
jgi:hypothetical protein